MLRSMMMMQLESRLVLCEDICRQYSSYDRRETPQVIAAKIVAVTKEDLVKVVRRMFASPLAVSVVGPLVGQHTPSYEDISRFARTYWEQANLETSAKNKAKY